MQKQEVVRSGDSMQKQLLDKEEPHRRIGWSKIFSFSMGIGYIYAVLIIFPLYMIPTGVDAADGVNRFRAIAVQIFLVFQTINFVALMLIHCFQNYCSDEEYEPILPV